MTTNPSISTLQPHRFNVDEYHRMAEVGILHPDCRVELIEGEIVDMSPIGSKHQGTLIKLTKLFFQLLGDSFLISPQGPIRLGKNNEPEPDLTLLKNRADAYTEEHPKSEDVVLLVEIAQSSLSYDLEVKMPLYARFEIPELWIIDLEKDQIIQFTQPAEGAYQRKVIWSKGDEFQCHAFSLSIQVDAFL